MIVKRIEPHSLARVSGLLYGILGLVMGCLFTLVSLAGGWATEQGDDAAARAVFGVGAVFFLPIVYGAIGFLGSLLMAALYNVGAKWVGGIEIRVESVSGADSEHDGGQPGMEVLQKDGA